MSDEKYATYDPSVSSIVLSLMLGFFESFLVAVQDLDVEFVCFIDFGKVVQDSGDDRLIVVFADAEAVFAVAEISIYPAKMGGVEWIDCYGFLDEIKLVATDDVGFGARALVSRGPVGCTILFDFLEKLVGPQVFQFYLDVFSVFI